MRGLAFLAALVALSPAPADAEDGVRFVGSARLRWRAERNFPSTAVRWDPASGTLDLPGSLATEGREAFGSALASVGLEGRHLDGDLRWAITADTGELRLQRFHVVGQVCWSDRTDSGLAAPGSGQCDLFPRRGLGLGRVIVPVEETGLEADPTLTSNGRPFEEEARDTLLLREAYVSYRFGRAGFATLTVGRKRVVVADGYVHDDYATGVLLQADVGAIGPQWDLAAGLYQPGRGTWDQLTPMLIVRADYLPSLFERAGLFLVGLEERGGSLGGIFRDAVEERLVQASLDHAPGTAVHQRANQLLVASASARYEGSGRLGWAGTSGLLTPWKGHRLAWTAALLGGQVDRITVGSGATILAERVAVRGQLASVRWETDLGRPLTARAWFLFLSGGQLPRTALDANGQLVPATGSYGGFLGISPYLTETSLFFGGGLSESYADRSTQAPGLNGRGVIAPGVGLRWAPSDRLTVNARGAWLQAVEAGPFGGRGYGTEVDLDASWELRAWLVVGAEADVLFPGDFFRGTAPITRTLLALDFLTP